MSNIRNPFYLNRNNFLFTTFNPVYFQIVDLFKFASSTQTKLMFTFPIISRVALTLSSKTDITKG